MSASIQDKQLIAFFGNLMENIFAALSKYIFLRQTCLLGIGAL